MNLLRRALTGDPDVALDEAALELAAIQTPGLDSAPSLEILDRIAFEIGERADPSASGEAFVIAANEWLFGELGFRGNETAYYDPRNSCLDQVLDLRTGIPITLSVVYIEVARRLKRPVAGVGLPGHFLVQYDDGECFTYIDPFHGGRLLDELSCRQVAREIAGAEAAAEPSALAPVGTRYILTRMLNNLRSAYFRARDFAKAATALDYLVEAFPENAEYYKARGVARLQLREFRAARSDLGAYLAHAPQAEDRIEVTCQLEAIHRWLGRLN